VQPAQRISFLTTPLDLGRWAWHCHLLFHMDAGMFREVVVS
jgi:FtsP/CotA-like multicopper oxidase with cupredoxin domain